MKASDCKCIKCGAPAVCFWPVVDVDIPSHPYCRACVEKAKVDLMVAIALDSDKYLYSEDKERAKKKKRVQK